MIVKEGRTELEIEEQKGRGGYTCRAGDCVITHEDAEGRGTWITRSAMSYLLSHINQRACTSLLSLPACPRQESETIILFISIYSDGPICMMRRS